MSKPILSIITVCYSAKNDLHETINSILQQTWQQFEYIVIDGGSSDGSYELLQKTQSAFHKKNIIFRFISEPDQGIYDAMNKGIALAEGQWLLFLNAGDLFANCQVLEHVFRMSFDADIIYGDTLCVYQGNKKLYSALPLEHLTYEMSFCHQSAFISAELMKKNKYDTSYKVCADHYFFLSMYLKGTRFIYIPFAISVYEIAGYSDKNKLLAHKEQQRMQKELGVFQKSSSWLLRECVFYAKHGIKQILGQKAIDLVRKKRLQ